jgi:uncharacterized membrane protein YqiK
MSKELPTEIMARLIEVHDNHPKIVKQTAERIQRIEDNTRMTKDALARAEMLNAKRLVNPNYQRRYDWLVANRSEAEAKAYWDKWARAPRPPAVHTSPKTRERELALKAVERAMRPKGITIRRR